MAHGRRRRHQSRSPTEERFDNGWCETCEAYTQLVGCTACQDYDCERCHLRECLWFRDPELYNDTYHPPVRPDEDDPPALHDLWEDYLFRLQRRQAEAAQATPGGQAPDTRSRFLF